MRTTITFNVNASLFAVQHHQGHAFSHSLKMRSLTHIVLYSTRHALHLVKYPCGIKRRLLSQNCQVLKIHGCARTLQDVRLLLSEVRHTSPWCLPYSIGLLWLQEIYTDILRDESLGKSNMTSPHAFPPPPECSVLAVRARSHVRPDS